MDEHHCASEPAWRPWRYFCSIHDKLKPPEKQLETSVRFVAPFKKKIPATDSCSQLASSLVASVASHCQPANVSGLLSWPAKLLCRNQQLLGLVGANRSNSSLEKRWTRSETRKGTGLFFLLLVNHWVSPLTRDCLCLVTDFCWLT